MTIGWMNEWLVAFTTFFATIGPVDTAVVFAALSAGEQAHRRRVTAFKGVAIASAILLVFALLGNDVLAYMGITLPALRIAGGILLLLIAVDMVRNVPTGGTSTTKAENAEAEGKSDISVFPLATPLIAGPGAMGAAILLMAQTDDDLARQGAVLGALATVLAVTLLLLLIATQVQKLLGVTGLNVITRVMGVLLAALAVQFILDGVAKSGLLG